MKAVICGVYSRHRDEESVRIEVVSILASFVYFFMSFPQHSYGEGEILRYKVKPGETLFCIAEKYFGYPVAGPKGSIALVKRLNNLESGQLESGQVLVLPVLDKMNFSYFKKRTLRSSTECMTDVSSNTYRKYVSKQKSPERRVSSIPKKEDQFLNAYNGNLEFLIKIHFDFNSWFIHPRYYQQVNEIARIMMENSESKLIIEGHTDSIDSHEYNLDLSWKRAYSVSSLISSFDPSLAPRVFPQGKGEAFPISSNESPEGRLRNRRVVGVFKASKPNQFKTLKKDLKVKGFEVNRGISSVVKQEPLQREGKKPYSLKEALSDREERMVESFFSQKEIEVSKENPDIKELGIGKELIQSKRFYDPYRVDQVERGLTRVDFDEHNKRHRFTLGIYGSLDSYKTDGMGTSGESDVRRLQFDLGYSRHLWFGTWFSADVGYSIPSVSESSSSNDEEDLNELHGKVGVLIPIEKVHLKTEVFFQQEIFFDPLMSGGGGLSLLENIGVRQKIKYIFYENLNLSLDLEGILNLPIDTNKTGLELSGEIGWGAELGIRYKKSTPKWQGKLFFEYREYDINEAFSVKNQIYGFRLNLIIP